MSTDPAAAVAEPRAGTPGHLSLSERYLEVRSRSEALCEPLEVEDYVVQSMPDASPIKWHLAHTSWFFETFVLEPHLAGYEPLDPSYAYLFNSYYNSLGAQYSRPDRGLITRPTVSDVRRYRRYVDVHVDRLLETAAEEKLAAVGPLVEVGLHHEQQHQELMLTDLKHLLAQNPLSPVYRARHEADAPAPPQVRWHAFEGGLRRIGHGGESFAFDNEGPRHRVFLEPFELASRLVTCGEMLDFLADGGYRRPELWLSDGWATVQEEGWTAPLYWREQDGGWKTFTLAELRRVDPAEPACHLSYYEADAYARWADARLPAEAEWETAACAAAEDEGIRGNFADDGRFHPAPRAGPGDGLAQLFGDVWEWTASPYVPYPGYRPPAGALGEYNAKFMSNQMVLRGGSCATSRSHVRVTYRNFFQPEKRWQASGLRLARDAEAP